MNEAATLHTKLKWDGSDFERGIASSVSHAAGMAGKMKEAGHHMGKGMAEGMSHHISAIKGELATLAAAWLSIEGAKKLGEGLMKTWEKGAAFKEMATATGASVEHIAVLDDALKRAGVDTNLMKLFMSVEERAAKLKDSVTGVKEKIQELNAATIQQELLPSGEWSFAKLARDREDAAKSLLGNDEVKATYGIDNESQRNRSPREQADAIKDALKDLMNLGAGKPSKLDPYMNGDAVNHFYEELMRVASIKDPSRRLAEEKALYGKQGKDLAKLNPDILHESQEKMGYLSKEWGHMAGEMKELVDFFKLDLPKAFDAFYLGMTKALGPEILKNVGGFANILPKVDEWGEKFGDALVAGWKILKAEWDKFVKELNGGGVSAAMEMLGKDIGKGMAEGFKAGINSVGQEAVTNLVSGGKAQGAQARGDAAGNPEFFGMSTGAAGFGALWRNLLMGLGNVGDLARIADYNSSPGTMMKRMARGDFKQGLSMPPDFYWGQTYEQGGGDVRKAKAYNARFWQGAGGAYDGEKPNPNAVQKTEDPTVHKLLGQLTDAILKTQVA